MVGHRSSYGGRPGAVWIRRKRHSHSHPCSSDSSRTGINTSPPETSASAAAAAADYHKDVLPSQTIHDNEESSPRAAAAAAADAVVHVHPVPTTANVSSGSETEADHHPHPPARCHHRRHDDSSPSDGLLSGMDSSPDSFSNDRSGVGGGAGGGAGIGGGARRLIGWDDDLGRPIYELVAQQQDNNNERECPGPISFGTSSGIDAVSHDADIDATTSSENDGDRDETQDGDASSLDEDDGDNNIQLSLTQESYFDDAPPSSSKVTVVTKESSRARASRSYGGRKRGRAGLSAAAEAILLDSHGDNEQAAAAAAAAAVAAGIPQAKKTKRDTNSNKNKKAKKKETDDCASASPTNMATTADISTGDTSPSQSRAGGEDIMDRPTSTVATTSATAAIPTEFDVLTPQPYSNNRDSICNFLDSDVQKSTTKTAATPVRTKADMKKKKSKGLVLDMDAKDDSDKEEQGQHQQKQEQMNLARRQYGRRLKPRKSTTVKDSSGVSPAKGVSPANTEVEPSELDFEATADNDNKKTAATAASSKPNQPCGQTSLSAARAFFEHLDATHQLAVDNTAQSPELRRNRRGGGAAANNIRTMRSVRVDDAKLRREYEEYCNTTEVTPLPIRDYVKHRMSFFRSSTTICDGLLDVHQ